MAHKNKKNHSPYKARRQKPTTGALSGRHKKPEVVYSLQEANDRIYDIFCNHGMRSFPSEKILCLAHFYQLLMENQKKQNFTRLLRLKDIAIKHFIDSLVITKLTPLSFPLMDVGTGPGFPGIPLKIQFPEEKIFLAEGVQKRVAFLKEVRKEMGLKNLDIIGRNINEEFEYPVNGVITRAVEDIPNTLRNVSQCLQNGGKVFLMKGPEVDHEIELFKQSQWTDYYKLSEDHAYTLEQTPHKRRLLVFEKFNSPPPVEIKWEDDDL